MAAAGESSCAPSVPSSTVATCIAYEDLLLGQVSSSSLAAAFGPDGLGLVCVTGGEEFSERLRQIRRHFLPWGSRLEELTKEDLGELRSLKGVQDETLVESRRQQGKYYDGHWLTEPSYKSALNYKFSPSRDQGSTIESKEARSRSSFGELGRDAAGFVTTVGAALAKQLDAYIGEALAEEGALYQGSYLAETVQRGDHFVRLLSYHSVESAAEAEEMGGYWARPHFDTSLLTGLVPGVFVESSTGASFAADSTEAQHISEVLAPSTGLVVVDRQGQHRKILAPQGREALFFQAGEALNIVSGGAVQATPHYVLAPQQQQQQQGSEGSAPSLRIDRNTLAVFLSVRREIPVPRNLTLERIAARTFDISRLGVRWPCLRQRLEEMECQRSRFFRSAHSLGAKEYEAQLSEWRSAKFKISEQADLMGTSLSRAVAVGGA